MQRVLGGMLVPKSDAKVLPNAQKNRARYVHDLYEKKCYGALEGEGGFHDHDGVPYEVCFEGVLFFQIMRIPPPIWL